MTYKKNIDMFMNFRIVLISGLFFLLTACPKAASPEPEAKTDNFDRTALLKHIGEDIILPSYRQWKGDVAKLDVSITAFVKTPTITTLKAARTALRTAYLSWQTCSFFEFGPADKAILRGLVNTYPVQSENIESNIKKQVYDLTTVGNISSIGFPALDYLLNGIAKSDEAIINLYRETDKAKSNHKRYLTDVVALLKTKATEVQQAWESAQGDYLKTFVSSIGTEVGSPLGLLINAYIQHYERFTRDGKIGIPLGIRSAGIPRPITAEAYYGGYSIALATQNLKALQTLYLGTTKANSSNTLGLDDLLVSLGKTELNKKITAQFTAILERAATLKDPLIQQIQTDSESVKALYVELQKLLVLVKVDMASAIGIIITYQDNDGD